MGLDGYRKGCYQLELMIRVLQIVVALAMVFSIAYVLITPDPTDDVEGILLSSNHPLTVHRLIGVSVPQFQMLTIVLACLSTVPAFNQCLNTSELLDLTCVYRC
jgi:hypothetical protein